MHINPNFSRGTNRAAEECDRVADIIRQRSGTHGDAFANLQDIADRWSRYIQKTLAKKDPGESFHLTVDDVAYLMVEMKMSRVSYGDKNEIDHLRDILGYSAIGAAFLQTQQRPTAKGTQENVSIDLRTAEDLHKQD